MLGGLALFAAGVGAAAALQPPPLIEAVLVMVALAAWLIGAYALVGYLRWYFASEVSRAQRESREANDNKGE